MRNFLLLILLFFVGSWLSRKLRQAPRPTQARDARPGAAGAEPAREAGALPEPMVRCAQCGVHAPKGEAVRAGGQFFCSTEHASRYASANSREAG
ncbi:MAG: hypothetical protein GAK40_00108 [Burkholderia plantarii]|nr:MAG: hypothetical protein GAK40_00108 [Burkholderia plantarii]